MRLQAAPCELRAVAETNKKKQHAIVMRYPNDTTLFSVAYSGVLALRRRRGKFAAAQRVSDLIGKKKSNNTWVPKNVPQEAGADKPERTALRISAQHEAPAAAAATTTHTCLPLLGHVDTSGRDTRDFSRRMHGTHPHPHSRCSSNPFPTYRGRPRELSALQQLVHSLHVRFQAILLLHPLPDHVHRRLAVAAHGQRVGPPP